MVYDGLVYASILCTLWWCYRRQSSLCCLIVECVCVMWWCIQLVVACLDVECNAGLYSASYHEGMISVRLEWLRRMRWGFIVTMFGPVAPSVVWCLLVG